MKTQSGFTLIELLITMVVAAILITTAVPNFKLTIQENRLVSQSNDLLGTLIYARAMAINLNSTVTVCATSDMTSCSGSTNFATGWLVKYTDSSSTVQYLRKHEAIPSSNSLTTTFTGGSVSFLNSGLTSGTTNGYFSICDSRGASKGRSLYLSASGFAKLSPTVGMQIDGTTALTC